MTATSAKCSLPAKLLGPASPKNKNTREPAGKWLPGDTFSGLLGNQIPFTRGILPHKPLCEPGTSKLRSPRKKLSTTTPFSKAKKAAYQKAKDDFAGLSEALSRTYFVVPAKELRYKNPYLNLLALRDIVQALSG